VSRNLRGAIFVLVVVVAALVFVESRRPDPGTAKWVASKVDDPPDDCGSPDVEPLQDRDEATWGTWAERSAVIHCGAAGPGLVWAHFRSTADRDTALRASSGRPDFVCRTDHDLVRMSGFPRESETATCEALDGHPV
jgi:hypothetical protein